MSMNTQVDKPNNQRISMFICLTQFFFEINTTLSYKLYCVAFAAGPHLVRYTHGYYGSTTCETTCDRCLRMHLESRKFHVLHINMLGKKKTVFVVDSTVLSFYNLITIYTC